MAAAAVAVVKIKFKLCSAVRAGYSVLSEHIFVKINRVVAGGAFYFIKILVFAAIATVITAIVIAVNNVFNRGKILVNSVKLLHELIAAVLYFAYFVCNITQYVDNSGKNLALLGAVVKRKTLGKTFNISYFLTNIPFANLRF